MKYCTECGYRVQTEEKTCPLCGCRLKTVPGGGAGETYRPHTHEKGESCLLPNQEAPQREKKPAARPRIYRPLFFVLALFFGFSTLTSLMMLVLGPEHLGSLIFSGALALLFWGLALTPRGADEVSLPGGRRIPVKQFVLTLLIIAFAGTLLLDILFA